MRTGQDIQNLLEQLDHATADDLEDQDLDFKQWDLTSRDKAVKTVVQMAVCMANSGGGTVVFGIADHLTGRQQAILGVPPEIDINRLKKAVYDQTDPKIMPVFDTLAVSEGTGRLLIMQIHPGLSPYTDTAGRGTIRIGKDCQSLTGTLRRKIAVETGETDFSAETVHDDLTSLLSAVAMDHLRTMAREQSAPEDLLAMNDRQLLQALGLMPNGKVSKGAILLCGNEDALRAHIPAYHWIFLHMTSDTYYDIREDQVSAIPVAISRFEDLLKPFNPLTTVEHGLYHFEYSTYPLVAYREALMNAFCHADYRIPGPVLTKLFRDQMVISNSGGFIAGITPANIIHHQPAARNPLLVEALSRLRLVNRSNLGVSRMFSAMLIEGKPPPIIVEIGESIAVTFLKSNIDPTFRRLVANVPDVPLNVDELLVLRHLRAHPLASLQDITANCLNHEQQILKTLDALVARALVEKNGGQDQARWQLSGAVKRHYTGAQSPVDPRQMIRRLLQAHHQTGTAMQSITEETGMSRSSAKRLLEKMRGEGLVRMTGKGPAVRWFYDEK